MEFSLFPWQEADWLRVTKSGDRLPHAMLFYGQEGIGKTAFASHLAQGMLCSSPGPQGHPWGSCLAWGWVLANQHPDLLVVRPGVVDEQEGISTDVEGAEGET